MDVFLRYIVICWYGYDVIVGVVGEWLVRWFIVVDDGFDYVCY